jgi:hypothetical protein
MILETQNLATAVEMTPPPPGQCPKCGKPLIDPFGLGWCKSCGYCKSLADDAAQQLIEEKRTASLGGVVEAGGALTGLPLWFWLNFLWVAIGIFFSIVMANRLPEGNNLQRAAWASLQILVGWIVVFLGQWFALVTIAPDEPSLSFKDAIFPFKLWGFIIKRLPQLKECLWTALLGLSLIVGSAAFIGGFEHWLSYLPKSLVEQEKDRAKAKTVGGTAAVLPME